MVRATTVPMKDEHELLVRAGRSFSQSVSQSISKMDFPCEPSSCQRGKQNINVVLLCSTWYFVTFGASVSSATLG